MSTCSSIYVYSFYHGCRSDVCFTAVNARECNPGNPQHKNLDFLGILLDFEIRIFSTFLFTFLQTELCMSYLKKTDYIVLCIDLNYLS